jgi:hypothetical protein
MLHHAMETPDRSPQPETIHPDHDNRHGGHPRSDDLHGFHFIAKASKQSRDYLGIPC